MKLLGFVLLSSGLALVSGAGLEVGKQFTYDVTIQVGAGTLDYAPHSAGGINRFKLVLQTENDNKLNCRVSEVKGSEYVGPIDPQNIRPDLLPTIDRPEINYEFNVNSKDGLIEEISFDGSLPLQAQNSIKAFAGLLQVNLKEILAGNQSFRSKEKTIHGKCDVTYTVTSQSIYKSMSHARDCPMKPVRRIDGVRGWWCEKREDPTTGLVATSSSVYDYEKSGSGMKITAIRHSGAVVSQMFGSEGFSQIALVNTTAVLVDESSNPGGISSGSETVDCLKYHFSDEKYKWNANRDLKAAEPFTSSGLGSTKSEGDLEQEMMDRLNNLLKLARVYGNDEASVEQHHKYGIENMRPLMWHMSYDSLMSIYNKVWNDKSEGGKVKSNVYTELLGSTGTSASAMAVKEIITSQKYDNCRDAARILISVPYHQRRPNKQLVEEYKSLLESDQCEYVKRSAPLVLGHLVERTCSLAEEVVGDHKEQAACFRDLGAKWVGKFWEMYQGTSDRNMKNVYMGAMNNAGFGGQAQILQPLIEGKMGESDEMRVYGMWAALRENIVHKKAVNVYFPVFAEPKNNHEVRIHAFMCMMAQTPTTTSMARVIGVLRMEKDYEVLNFAKSYIQKMAATIDPCKKDSQAVAGFFLKYLKQFDKTGLGMVDWGLGVSKTYKREFYQQKYGYSGSVEFTTVGAHDSTTPISIGMSLGTTLHKDYRTNNLYIGLRIEGLAKALIKKFKKMDPSTWKISTLKGIMSEMGIRERPSQAVRVGYLVMVKGKIAFQGSFDDTDAGSGGKMQEFMSQIKDLGKNINHQRLLNAIQVMVEQPTDIGIPAVYLNSVSGLFSVQANGGMSQKRGEFVLSGNYKLHLLIHGQNKMMIETYNKQMATFGISQDRIYHVHIPRKLQVAVNPTRREVKISVSRPERDDPAMLIMHSKTSVEKVEKNQVVKSVEVSKGEEKKRTIADNDSSKWGFHWKGEYFDCEADAARRNTVQKLIGAFSPRNKNPQDAFTSIGMGIRQVLSFMMLYPRAEKCGMYFSWSQSSQNPVRTLQISLSGKSDELGEKIFLRGKQLKVQVTFKAVGDKTRAYKMQMVRKTSPGDLQIQTKVDFQRAATADLGIDAYKICMVYKAKYPSFESEMWNLDMSKDLSMKGEAKIEYGKGTDCSNAEGVVGVKFQYSTTAEARESLKEKSYYKKCMESKTSSEWSGRNANPLTWPCLRTYMDGTRARKYVWDVKLEKVTDRARNIISTVKSIAKVAAMPVFGVDASGIDVDQIGKSLHIDAVLKDGDSSADVTIKTDSGEKKIENYALKMDWSRRLRSLSASWSRAQTGFRLGVLKNCMATKESVETLDKFTYKYDLPSCWTMISGHCGDNPSYAVFAKNAGGKMAVKVYVGGHEIEYDGGNGIKVNGAAANFRKGVYKLKRGNTEIFGITKWGSTFNVYSYLKVWIMFDGNFVSTTPAPSVKGQHCGLCGNYNRNKWDDMMGKDMTPIKSVQDFVADYKWKC